LVAAKSLRIGRPLWLDQPGGVKQRYPVLSGSHATAIAIVGGGLTGALVAHAFATAGIATTLLEARLAGTGSTVASSALLLREPDRELTELRRRYGPSRSRQIWTLSQESVEQLVALLTRLRVDCDLRRRDAIYYATTNQAARRLGREYDLRTRSGFEAEWLGSGELRRLTGLTGHGAIRTTDSAQCDPYRACIGVLRAAAAAGADVHERSAVHRIDVTPKGVRLRTRQGTLDAEHVIIATGYATAAFQPLAGRFRFYRTYVLVTEPMSAADRRELGLTDVMIWDTDRPYHYARWTTAHRLLIGGEDRLVRPGPGRRQQFAAARRDLRAHFEARFPALAAIPTERAWEGLFALTPDSLPYIGPHRRYPRHWFALGYGGNGMTFGALAARLLLGRWQGDVSRDHALFEFGRF
jgi:glycine/D-amino acid oxidase-like deaminating enzyme